MIDSDALVHPFDSVLMDLDGVVYVGRHAIPAAVSAIDRLVTSGTRVCFVTNNASRPPGAVAEQLGSFGLTVDPSDVHTSAQAGAELVKQRVAPGATVLAVGGPGVAEALAEAGLAVIDAVRDPDGPSGGEVAAVLQGFGPDVSWRALARAAFAVERGVPWVATNTDMTIPVEGGIAPGNGTLVAAVATATDRQPVVAGKPFAPLLQQAQRLNGGSRPLVVGDRLDTDIAGAANASMPSLLVMSGVTQALALWRAGARERPDFVARDVSGLLTPPRFAGSHDGVVRSGAARSRIVAGELIVDDGGDPLAGIWAAAHLLWSAEEEPANAPEVAGRLDRALAGPRALDPGAGAR